MTDAEGRGLELLDTCVVARYLVGDAPDLARRAAALIDSDRPLGIALVVIAELGYLLTRHYGVDRARVVAALADLLSRANIEAHGAPTEVAIEALQMCAPSGRVSFADAMLWAAARAAPNARVWTFDEAFPPGGISVQAP